MPHIAPAPPALVIPDLAGKRVLITGAATGIGRELAEAFAEQGARVAVHYAHSEDAAWDVAGAIGRRGGEPHVVQGDLTKPEECERVVAEAAKALGGLDGLINNAGLMLGRVPTTDATDAHFDEVIALNARSVFSMSRAAVPHLKQAGGGFIIHTTSVAARHGGGGGAVLYAAAKGFVSTFAKGQAKELIAEGVRVNAVSPGVIETPFHDRYSTPEQLEAMRKTIPIGRLGRPEDCVGAYLFLASEMLSGYMIGQVLEVNGGQLMP
jgi:3-oxoacyl-[acyl-carrier protein] reductase